jgi:hypothetical protein
MFAFPAIVYSPVSVVIYSTVPLLTGLANGSVHAVFKRGPWPKGALAHHFLQVPVNIYNF